MRRARRADGARRLDELRLAHGQRLAAHDAARDHPFLVDEREDDVLHAGPIIAISAMAKMR